MRRRTSRKERRRPPGRGVTGRGKNSAGPAVASSGACETCEKRFSRRGGWVGGGGWGRGGGGGGGAWEGGGCCGAKAGGTGGGNGGGEDRAEVDIDDGRIFGRVMPRGGLRAGDADRGHGGGEFRLHRV